MQYGLKKIKVCPNCKYHDPVGHIIHYCSINLNQVFRSLEITNQMYKDNGCTDCERIVIRIEE